MLAPMLDPLYKSKKTFKCFIGLQNKVNQSNKANIFALLDWLTLVFA